MFDIGSGWRGIRAMHRKWWKGRPDGPGWHVMRIDTIPFETWRDFWWFHFWTPTWHKGRGPFVSIGLGVIAIARGY